MKEKLLEKLGTLGGILYYFLLIIISVLPIVVLPTRGILSFLLLAIMFFFPSTSIIFWIWGLVCAIKGPQDVIAIVYYICFVVIFAPTFFSIISVFFKKKDR